MFYYKYVIHDIVDNLENEDFKNLKNKIARLVGGFNATIDSSSFEQIQTLIKEVITKKEEEKIFAARAAMAELFINTEREASTSAAAVAAAAAASDEKQATDEQEQTTVKQEKQTSVRQKQPDIAAKTREGDGCFVTALTSSVQTPTGKGTGRSNA